ncbi:hypothetical protein BN59_01141 [Legionella massiliensis]|uniref:DUF2207 domain-containing protein n=1 Tax=Legionella massiliensis TaxID=1034943 RepID=A0A078KR18_9GAMM|nr:DUF2207 domain-containing protein [Legionella massiliensis]CDZ76865.1 hypothetical protein BN59_01141 [Legionella massiliensis]CEE12603.1 hypothetical protein BN1094_01141 [Legionella massiliensis]
MLKRYACYLFILAQFYCSILWANTVINSYDEIISFKPDNLMVVQDKITLTTDGLENAEGLYRAIPKLLFEERSANIVFSQLNVISATLNNSTIPYSQDTTADDVRIYLGDKNKPLAQGTYSYSLTFSVVAKPYFYDHKTQLVWSVTGKGWSYPILKASTYVQLPSETFQNATAYEAFNDDIQYKASLYPHESAITFQATDAIEPGQQLGFIIGWKNMAAADSFSPRVSEKKYPAVVKSDSKPFKPPKNLVLLIFGSGVFFIFIFYFYAWSKSRIKKSSQVIIPRYKPPKGVSPQVLRYAIQMGYDRKVLTAAILNLVAKDYLKLVGGQLLSNNYTLIRNPDFKGQLSSDELALTRALFARGRNIDLHSANFAEVERDFIDALMEANHDKYFVTNSSYRFLGVLFSSMLLGLNCLYDENLIGIVALFIWLIIITFLIMPYLKKARARSLKERFYVLVMSTMVVATFILVGVEGPRAYFGSQAWVFTLLYYILAVINLVFIYLLKQRTKLGQRITKHAEGFKLFLLATEEERVSLPELTPVIIEEYLPYALALDIELHWSQQFANILAAKLGIDGVIQ